MTSAAAKASAAAPSACNMATTSRATRSIDRSLRRLSRVFTSTLAHHEDRPAGVLGDLLGDRAEEQPGEIRAAAVADYDEIRAGAVGVIDELLGGMPHCHFVVRLTCFVAADALSSASKRRW